MNLKSFRFLMLCVCLSMTGTSAHAQSKKWILMEGQALPPAVNEERLSFSDPEFEAVTYLKMQEPKTLRERIERLVHGVYVDLPPEYDYYGYEIRRYMAHIGGPLIPGSQANLKGQLQNIRNARIVANHWRNKLMKEIRVIEAELKQHQGSSSERSLFKYNSGIIRAFFTEMGFWLDNNQKSLQYLLEIGPGAYSYENPVFRFTEKEHQEGYEKLYDAQLRALDQIRKYPPFRMMLY